MIATDRCAAGHSPGMTIRILLAAACIAGCTVQPHVDLGSAPFMRLTPDTEARQIALDGSHLYWLSWNVPPPPGWQGPETSLLYVTKADKDGSNASVLARTAFTADNVFGSFALAVDGSNVIFTDETFVDMEAASGGSPTTMFTGQATDVGGVAIDDTDLYWTVIDPSGTAGTVMKMPKTGGMAVLLASNQQNPGHIVVDDTNVYWVDDGNGELVVLPKSGGTPMTLATDAAGSSLVVDETDVYYNPSMLVKKVAKTGGPTTVVASDVLVTGDLTGDATDLYFARDFNQVARVTKADYSMTIVYDALTDPTASSIDVIALDDTSLYWSFDDGSIGTQPK